MQFFSIIICFIHFRYFVRDERKLLFYFYKLFTKSYVLILHSTP